MILALEARLVRRPTFRRSRSATRACSAGTSRSRRSHAAKAPTAWRRKQTVASGERYTSDELDQSAGPHRARRGAHAERESELFTTLVRAVGPARRRASAGSRRGSQSGTCAALAEVAHRHDYVRPEVDDGDAHRDRGRAPSGRGASSRPPGRFVPNDVALELDGERALDRHRPEHGRQSRRSCARSRSS